MNKYLFDALRCPFCSGKFAFRKGDLQSEYAVLTCYCERYPVVAGIPIIRKGVLGARGETAQTLTELIESGKNQDALLAMTLPNPPSAELAPGWSKRLPRVKGIGRIKSFFGGLARPYWTKVGKEFLIAGPQGRTAKDYFDFHFLRPGRTIEEYHYYINRFGQPRHLVALSLMTLIEHPNKPLLDFGCGFGHLTRHLPSRVGYQPIIGADRQFIRLYVAKNFLAPEVTYVCCDGDASLPFRSNFFSFVYSSDTLYMVSNKVVCSREIQRVLENDGLIIVAGIRNGLVEPEKFPGAIPYFTYGELFDDLPHRVLANSEIVKRYTKKLGPVLARSSDKQVLDHEPWFSIVATKREELLIDRGLFVDWPHAEGPLELNPLYQPVHKNLAGETLYRHTFPSSWYEQEDGDCRKYEPESVLISSEILRDLSSGKRTDDMEDLIARCVIIGVPDRFK
jgi:SAM-dependent methyltransferase